METQRTAYWEAAVRCDSGDLEDTGKERRRLCTDYQNCKRNRGAVIDWKSWSLLVLLWITVTQRHYVALLANDVEIT